jgi:hypothetical protein
VIVERGEGVSGALADIGSTIPGQAWTYWHPGPGPGPDYLDDDRGHDWAASTGRAMASNLVHAARALAENRSRLRRPEPSGESALVRSR